MVYGGLDASHRPSGMTGHDQGRQSYVAGHGERAKGRGLWGVPVGLHDFGQAKVMVYGEAIVINERSWFMGQAVSET